MASATTTHASVAASQPTKMAHGMPIPASMANFGFSKCDPCRRRKKGPCSGDEPCTQCVERGRPDECSREHGKKMLEDEIAKKKRALVGALEPAAQNGRKCAATTTNLENENNSIIDTPPPALTTRRAAQIADEKARKEAEEAAKAAEPQFEFKLPNALDNWDHNKCDRCRKIKAACDGNEPCPNCIAGEADCTKKEGRKTFSMKRADEFVRQKHRFDVKQAKAKDKKKKDEAKRQEDLRNSEIKMSKLLDERRNIKGSLHIAKMEATAMAKKRKEQEPDETEARSELEKKAEDSDVEMMDAEQDEGYLTQTTPAQPPRIV